MDFGYTPETLNNNLEMLGVDPAKLDALMLSHGHYDHFGGLHGFLSQHKAVLRKELPFYLGGEECFCTREADVGRSAGSASSAFSHRTRSSTCARPSPRSGRSIPIT